MIAKHEQSDTNCSEGSGIYIKSFTFIPNAVAS